MIPGLCVAWPRGTNVTGAGPDEQTALASLAANLRDLAPRRRPPETLTISDQLLAAGAALSLADLTAWLRDRSEPAVLACDIDAPDTYQPRTQARSRSSGKA